MTSIVDTTVKHYRSDMPEAPVLNGVAGSKIAQLEACLVTGYGLKAATSLTVVSGIATLTFAGGASAAWQDAVILVAGANNGALNGEQKVLTTSPTTVTFATAQPDGTDAGTVTFKIASAGWEKVYSKANVAVFRSLHVESAKMLLRMDDTNPQFVRVRGYETMSDVDTGAGLFPTDAMIAGGGYWAKSDVTSAVAVAWILAGDGRFLLDSTAPGSNKGMTHQNCVLRGFGELIPRNPAGDAYLCGLNYSTNSSVGSMFDGTLDYDPIALKTALARGYTGLGSAVTARRSPYAGNTTLSATGSGNDVTFGSFPSPVDGSLILSRQYIVDTGTLAPRGDFPGHAYCPQSKVWDSFKMFDTLTHRGRKYITSSSGSGAGVSSSSATGASFMDITGPWR